ncbi:MAG: hypothetical protein AAFW70_10615 [Cyanobacteria bacterium J06635_10]
MLISEILRSLPANLEWMVLFNLPAVRPIAGDEVTRAMYFLPENTELEQYSHVVLSSEGRYLAPHDDSLLVDGITTETIVAPEPDNSLANRYNKQLELFDIDSADCLGLGKQAPYAPVLLHLKLENGCGKAQAIFDCKPTQKHYELLRAVGVTFKGGEQKEDYYLARFENRLPTHIHAGILSHFSRTGNCNLFFLQHGNIDSFLESGLRTAAVKRIQWGKQRSYEALSKLTTEACEQVMAMTCFPPAPEQPFAYGDLVPLGFVLKALQVANLSDSCNKLQQYLLDKRQEQLWAFHSNRLITATDSALILQSLDVTESIEALEQFSDGKGGYYPQLWDKSRQANKMKMDRSCEHWCQTDYSTTCLIRALRKKAGLSEKTSVEFLTAGMSNRSGLYFANPYLVDYFLALAIAEDDSAIYLRQQLLKEVLASRNEDFSFGTFDRAFSTSLAILTMATLGFKGRTLQASQLKLLEFIKADGKLPIAIPFYSTFKSERKVESDLLLTLLGSINGSQANRLKQTQIRSVCGENHEISKVIAQAGNSVIKGK